MWPYIGVANACIQILLIIGFGYVLTWRGLITDKFLPQVNTFLLLASFPCLNLYSIGISLNLRTRSGWLAIAAYIMWISIIQVCILIYVWVFKKRDVGEAALLNLLLAANNTIIIGLPIMNSTFGTPGRYVALLTGVPLFLQIMPFSIILFEMERWVLQQTKTASTPSLAIDVPHDTGSPSPELASPASSRPPTPLLPPSGSDTNLKDLAGDQHPPAPPTHPVTRVTAQPMPSLAQGIPDSPAQPARPPPAHPVMSAPELSDTLHPHTDAQDAHRAHLQPHDSQPSPSRRQDPHRHHHPPRGVYQRSSSIQEHLHQFFQQAAELRQRKKEEKKRRRMAAAVVDVPLPLGTAVQLGRELHTDKTDNAPGAAVSPHGHHGHPAGHEWPWDAWQTLLDATRTGMSRLANSFHLGSGSRAQMARHAADAVAASRASPEHVHVDLAGAGPHPHQAAPVPDSRLGAVTAPAAPHANGRSDKSFVRAATVQQAMQKAVHRHGSMTNVCLGFLQRVLKSQPFQIALRIVSNPMLWSLLLAMVISLSGLRVYLDPSSPDYVKEMGWLVDSLRMMQQTTVPLALFSNGSFLFGKKFWEGNVRKACVIIAVKVLVLPFLQLACCKAVGLDVDQAMSLVLLSVCPTATTSFVLATQYNHGAEVVTLVTIVLTVLLVPIMLAALYIPQLIEVYSFDTSLFPKP